MKRAFALLFAVLMLCAFASAENTVDNDILRLSVYEGGKAPGMTAWVCIDMDAGDMSLFALQSVSDLALYTVFWSEDEFPYFEPVCYLSDFKAGDMLCFRAFLTDCLPGLAFSYELNGEYALWYITDSGEDGSLILIPCDTQAPVQPAFFSLFE